MIKQSVVYVCDGILLSNKKELIPAITWLNLKNGILSERSLLSRQFYIV